MENNVNTEVLRCLNCLRKPCVEGCPLHNDIPVIISLVKEGKYEDAAKTLLNTSPIGSICGRICPHLEQCEGSCVRRFKEYPVQIGTIDSFVGDMILENNWKVENVPKKGKRVAIVGSGPAGLVCAYFLKVNGIDVTIYEKNDKLGGLLRYGIPEFRLDKDLVQKNIDYITDGMTIYTNMVLGDNLSLDMLEKEYDAVVLALGTNNSVNMYVAGEDLLGVYGGNELLEHQEYPDFQDKIVGIIGGGNVAMDAARTIKKFNPKKVMVIYRRDEKSQPASIKEIEMAKEEGIEFIYNTNVIEIMGDSFVNGVKCVKTEIVDGKVNNLLDTEFVLQLDYVVKCIGSQNKLFIDGLEYNSNGEIIVNNNQSNRTKVFACGDVSGAIKTVANAASSGRTTANAIIEFLSKDND